MTRQKSKAHESSPPQPSFEEILKRLITVEDRCGSIEKDSGRLGELLTRLRARVAEESRRIDRLEPEWIDEQESKLRDRIKELTNRSHAMVNRMIVTSEAVNLLMKRDPNSAVEGLRTILSAWDESDEFWDWLAKTPMGVWINSIDACLKHWHAERPSAEPEHDDTNTVVEGAA